MISLSRRKRRYVSSPPDLSPPNYRILSSPPISSLLARRDPNHPPTTATCSCVKFHSLLVLSCISLLLRAWSEQFRRLPRYGGRQWYCTGSSAKSNPTCIVYHAMFSVAAVASVCSVCNRAAASDACRAWSSSRARSGDLRTLSSVNRFRAEIGGQFRIATVSLSLSSACGGMIGRLRSRRLKKR